MNSRWRHVLASLIPESHLKETLRRLYYGRFNSLYRFNDLIERMEVSGAGDDKLTVYLTNGIRFHAPANEIQPEGFTIGLHNREFKYGNPRKLDKLKDLDIERFSASLSILWSIFVEEIYERFYPLQENDVIVDAGANIGIFAVKAANIVGEKGRVFAIEPEPGNLHFLRRNLQANGVKNCVVISKGLWSSHEQRRLFLAPAGGSHSLMRTLAARSCGGQGSTTTWMAANPDETPGLDESASITVEVDTLEALTDEFGIDRVNFVKMDIEGAEIEALEGMKNILNRDDAELAIEAFHLVDGRPSSISLLPRLKALGYRAVEKDGYVYGKKDHI